MPDAWINRPDVLNRGRSSGHTKPLELLATLWPGFAHFPKFAHDLRLAGVRINPPTIGVDELERELGRLDSTSASLPLWYDVKGRQLRIAEARTVGDHIECVLNHPIQLDLEDEAARIVSFKAGADFGMLHRIEDGGQRLVFRDGRKFGPQFRVNYGESVNIRHHSLRVQGPLFTDEECRKIAAAKRAGFTRYFLSYVEETADVDALLELVGRDVEVWLKIENERGLRFVANDFLKRDNLVLVAARGDLYIELERPHEICNALRLIIQEDPEACVGSRILLSIARRTMPPYEARESFAHILDAVSGDGVDAQALRELLIGIYHDPVPACADFSELAWLYDLGYRRMMLCDELCLDGTLLGTALNAFEAFRNSYQRTLS
ncbi:MAG: hypothetical protein HY437_02310 [Candidatus Magasanikbacteria bacterium]|nr:hypothetical protein [Candidatus Magasanikbacteria bacterium]